MTPFTGANMSIHGICYDNGQSGKCNEDCAQFLDGGCDVANEVISATLPSSTSDASHLTWVYERLNNVHGESLSYDFMLRLKKIIIKLRSQDYDERQRNKLHKPEHRKTIFRR